MISVLMGCLIISGCGGAAGTDTGSGSDSSGSSETLVSGLCADGTAVSVGQDTDEAGSCATIAVFLNLQTDAELASITRTVGEAVATGLSSKLSRATIVTSNDVLAAQAFAEMVQLLGGEDSGEVASRMTSSFTSADIHVIPTIDGDLDGTVTMTLAAYNGSDSKHIASVTFSGSATELGQSATALGESLAGQIKKARVCLRLTPVRAVIDFDTEAERAETFTASVKDLTDANLESGTVAFTLDNPSWGTLSKSSADIANGEATTVFTMTERQPNELESSYAGEFSTQTDTSVIIPQCGWLLTIEGNKTFALTQASPTLFHALFGDGSWITMNGTSTAKGHVALTVVESESAAYGTGWMTEEHNSTAEVYAPVRSADGTSIIGSCSSSGTTSGTANGSWAVFGTATSTSITISGLASGVSPVGQNVFASCNVGGLTVSGGGASEFGVLGEFANVSIALKHGATATISGIGSFFEEPYSYTLTLRRAAP